MPSRKAGRTEALSAKSEEWMVSETEAIHSTHQQGAATFAEYGDTGFVLPPTIPNGAIFATSDAPAPYKIFDLHLK
jgi:hypothetical protein